MQVVLTSPDVERLTGLTPEQMRDSHQYDFNVNDDLLLALDKLQVVCFVKKYDPKTMGSTRTSGLRFSVVKTYAYDSIDNQTEQPPSVSNVMNPNDSSAKSSTTTTNSKELETNDTTIEEHQHTTHSTTTKQHTKDATGTTKGQPDDDKEKQKSNSGEARPMKRGKNK